MKRLLPILLFAATSVHAELRLELVRHSLTGAHCRYREYFGGIPSDDYELRPCDARALSIVAESQPVAADASLRMIDGRVARRVIVEETPLEPVAYDFDVATGALLRTTPLFFHAKPARVFDPNPVAALNDPTLRDRNDAADAVPPSAYRVVELQDVVPSGPLAGPWVKLVDRQSPNVAPPDASSSLMFDRGADGFEDVQVYFHVDRNQRHLQSLGYFGARAVAAYAIEADAHSASGSDNSFFLPSATRASEGTLHFGTGGTDDAEDADLVVHEYGHAIQEWIAPGAFGGTFTSESRAIAEGFGDYWAYSAHAEQRRASGRDPFCFADWDARCWDDDASQQCGYREGSDCLRRLDGTRTMADYERTGTGGVEHRNGSIWSSALREIHDQLGRTITDTLVIESLFDVAPRPTFASVAQRMIEADRLLFSGVHANTICAVMSARGILTSCDATHPRGERTIVQSADHVLAIPDNGASVMSQLRISDTRLIENLYVRVDIEHPLIGDLKIVLLASDGTAVDLLEPSIQRGADLHVTFGIDADPADPLSVLRGHPANGVWSLVVSDTRARDTGSLLSWGLEIQFAGDEPQVARPQLSNAQVLPVVAHTFGVGAARFRSDVRIANPSDAAVNATLIFTPSGVDGRTNFSAIDIAVAPLQTIALDDVVASVFHTTGGGWIEAGGEVVVMSRTYAETANGTLGQQVPPVRETTSRLESPLLIAPLPEERTRYNVGITEIGGERGIVQIAGREIEVLPFSHVQFAYDGSATLVRVLEGEARVAAYVSQVNAIGDAMFIPAERVGGTQFTTPVAPGISTAQWRSDIWFGSLAETRVTTGALNPVFHPFGIIGVFRDPLVFVGSRVHNSNGTDQFIPFVGHPANVSAEQQLLFIETIPPYRTNIGVFNYFAREARAEVIVYDASGTERQRAVLQTVNGVAQMPVLPQLTSGRAVVRFLDGLDLGPGYAYASLVDGRTGDATYVPGR